MASDTHQSVFVWDLPVRLFHWLLVLCCVFLFVSGKIGGNLMVWHIYAGYAVLALVVFRIAWGFAGTRHARFADFVHGPAAAWSFVRELVSRRVTPRAGHNPLGGWMILVLLAALAIQATSGLFSNDDIATEGPLAALISKDLSDRLTTIHRLNVNVLLALVGAHVAAVLYHWLVLREHLVAAMFTGRKRLPAGSEADAPVQHGRVNMRALSLLVMACAIVFVVVKRPF